MASVASQLIEEVTAHAQSDSLEDVREICADGTYFRITYLRRCRPIFHILFLQVIYTNILLFCSSLNVDCVKDFF